MIVPVPVLAQTVSLVSRSRAAVPSQFPIRRVLAVSAYASVTGRVPRTRPSRPLRLRLPFARHPDWTLASSVRVSGRMLGSGASAAPRCPLIYGSTMLMRLRRARVLGRACVDDVGHARGGILVLYSAEYGAGGDAPHVDGSGFHLALASLPHPTPRRSRPLATRCPLRCRVCCIPLEDTRLRVRGRGGPRVRA